MVRGVKKSGLGGLVLMLAMTSLAGCGSDDNGDAVSKFDEFLGVWQFTKVTAVEECPGVDPFDYTIEMNQWMLPGLTSDLAAPGLFFGLCPFKFNVAGKIATLINEQCKIGILNDTEDYYTPMSGQFSLLQPTPEVRAAEETTVMMGKISFMSGANIVQLDCKLTINGTLIKAANSW